MMVVVFAICWYFNIGIIFSGLFAIIIAFAVSYLGFPRLHDAAGADMARWFKRKPRTKTTAEEENRLAEDSYVDAAKRERGEDF
ncbi:hypothetical protein GCM10007359_09830 [Rothia aerolata]|uniref:DUF4229 domain-containing protein n=1 Tax=Rothia aerolata TaxID=1812262 RepID=A0A917IQT2_9MICC|nr:hypothetical protein GCM10007359_09830 [Rothia aerolata]